MLPDGLQTSGQRVIANFVIFLHVSEFLRFWWIFFVFQKKLGYLVFLVHPPMALVLLSASIKRCFVSRMRDFWYILVNRHVYFLFFNKTLPM